MRNLSALTLSLCLAAGLAAQKRTHYYIDAVNGSDTNVGSMAKPFQSLNKALGMTKANAVIHVMPGVYGPATTKDFWDTAANTSAKYSLAGYTNFKICGMDREKCIIDFNGNTGKWYGYLDIGNGAKDVEICNLSFKNLGNTPWGNSPININGDALRVNIHSNHFTDCNSTFINWGGMDCAFHDNIIDSTVAKTGVAIRIRTHYWNATSRDKMYVYNNLIINNGRGISFDAKATSNQYVYNNLIVDCNLAFPKSTVPALCKLENNNAFGNTTNYSAATVPTSNTSVDPQFMDKAKMDYRLKATSPLIEAGYQGFYQFEVNDYAGNARGYDSDNDGVGRLDVGPYEKTDVSLSLVKGFAQGQIPEFSINSTNAQVALGFFVISAGKSGSTTFPIFHLDPFGTMGVDPTLMVIQNLISMPNANYKPLPSATPVNTAFNGLEVYAQVFGYQVTTSGDRFKPSGRLDLNL